MLHKRHGHSKVDTYINLSATTNEGILAIMARNGNFFKEMAITLVPYVTTLVPTLPSFKVNHTKPTTSILERIGKEQTLVVKNYKHMDEGVKEGGPVKKKSHNEATWSIRLEHMEDSDVFDFNMTQEMHPKDASLMQEQEIDRDDPFYVPILDHLMGATQVLECSQTQLLDAKNKTTSNFDNTMGRRKQRKVDKGKDSKGKKVRNMVVAKVDEDDGTYVSMDNTIMIVHSEAPLDGVVEVVQHVVIVTPPPHKALDVVTSPPP